MKITKFGQSCLLIEESGARIILDPGTFSTAQNSLQNIDMILITHEHGDHFSMDSVKEILKNNPEAKIFTTTAVMEILNKEGISSTVVANGETVTEKGITIEGVGELHAVLVNQMPQSQNVGFIIAGRLFYPGDAFTLPGKEIEILALPAAAPWAKLSEVVDYAIAAKPKIAFPVHDSILAHPSMMHRYVLKILGDLGIEFRPIELDTGYEF